MRGGASRTAEIVCWVRALESLRDEPVLLDPYARQFLRLPLRLGLPAGAAWTRLEKAWSGWPGVGAYIATRHRWMDEQLERCITDGVTEVLVLGAGFDSRALRFPGPRYWEVDHPATAARKRRVAPSVPKQVEVDFTKDDLATRLREEGFPEGSRTAVIWEGVTMYLTRAAVQKTLSDLAGLLGEGSVLVFDGFSVPDGHDWTSDLLRLSPTLMPLLGEPVSFFVHPDDCQSLMGDTGWAVSDIVTASMLRAKYSPDRVVYAPCFVVAATLGA